MCFRFWYTQYFNTNLYIYFSGSSLKGPEKDYSLSNNSETLIFGIFNALAIIATTFGNGIIPEIQVYI